MSWLLYPNRLLIFWDGRRKRGYCTLARFLELSKSFGVQFIPHLLYRSARQQILMSMLLAPNGTR